MCNGGQIGGILGGLGGTALSIFQPELLPFTLPLIAGAGGGSFLGTTIGDLVSGKPVGASLEEGAISGGISGALAGAGNLAAGGDFFGTPASSITGVFGGAPTAAADTLSGATTAATTGAALPGANLASAAPAAATTVAPTVGVGGGGASLGGDLGSGIGGAVGSTPANVSGAVGGGGAPIAGPAGNVGPLGTAGPTSLTTGLDNTGGAFIPGVDTAGITDVGGQVPGVSGGGGGFLSHIFGGGTTPASITATDASGGGAGGGFLGSLGKDLMKPSTLITGGAALLPLLQGNTIPGLSDLQNQAKTYNAMGTPLAQSLQTGNLPAGAQSSLDAQTRGATAAVRSRFAQMGLSGSSQEADALGMVQANEAGQKVKMLEDMTGIGLKEMASADPLLQRIMLSQWQQDQNQQQAVARLAAALAGSTGQEKTTA